MADRTARAQPADPASPYIGPLSQLVRRAFGPAAAVAETFDGLPGVGEVLIFGSWAARTSAATGNAWMYGNVYDETDNPLNWW